MVIKPNKDGTYTLVCCNGYTFTGTYEECSRKVNEIFAGNRKGNDMDEIMNRHYESLEKITDKLSEADQKYILYYLLGKYKEQLDQMISGGSSPKEIYEVYAREMMCQHSRACEIMREVILDEIF